MKKEEIDKLITDSLTKEEAEFYNHFEEEGVFESWFGVYKGKHGWMAAVQSIFITISTVVAIYCGYRFFTVDTMIELFRYGAGMFIGIMFTAFLKLWLWMQIDKNSVLREMKRMEFQIAVLMEKISDTHK
jgi:uncharacterized membrane protein